MEDQGTDISTSENAAADASASAASVTRPDWLPETYWNAEANSPNGEALTKDLADLTSLRGEAEARAKEIPQDGAYKFELPPELKLPEGIRYDAPDTNDPEVKAFSELAKGLNLTQSQYSKLLGFEAQRRLAAFQNSQKMEATRTQELKSLGENSAARTDQAKRWLNANLSEQEAKTLGFALNLKDGVTAIEKIIEATKGVSMRGHATGGNGKEPFDVTGKSAMQIFNAAVAGQ